MKLLHNQKGIALVTSLMLTLISLTIVMFLMYMITSSVKLSGANKSYKTSLEASYGGVDLIVKDVMPQLFSNLASPADAITAGNFGTAFNFQASSDASAAACLQKKLTSSSPAWEAQCSSSASPIVAPDMTVTLNSTSSNPYTVYTKIVDTVCSDKRPYPVGNCTGSDLSGVYLDGGSGVAGGSSDVAVQPKPAIYRIEVTAEKSNNPQEKSNLSVLYAY
ncbi:MAG: hypothetical protein PHY09_12990 [Desulfuromonadaceae bacterium]|nr:hypothetical protein [Desulfuromonadaceae bacterium]MDD5105311.1 hypothetical protein [Desulfuromonadaceae bacterium]